MTNEKIYVVTVQAFQVDANGTLSSVETIEKRTNDIFYRNVRADLVREVP